MEELRGAAVILTGATGGIGPRIAAALWAQGARLLLTARPGDGVESVQNGLDPTGSRTLALGADLTAATACEVIVDAAVQRFGGVDVVVNNAGIEGPMRLVDETPERLEAMVRLNLVAPLRLTRRVLPDMLARGRGHIVFVASLAGLVPAPFNSTYSATKHALVGLADSLSEELDGTGVGVSAVCPSGVREAGMYTRWALEGSSSRVGTTTPDAVAAAVVRAIRSNRRQVLVAPPLTRLGPLLSTAAHPLLVRLYRRTGMVGALRRTAEQNARRAG